MTNKELYRDFCRTNGELPLFMQDWWLDAVCAGKQWDVLLSFNSEGIIQAALPYLLRKRAWMTYIVMPQQTQIGGMWLADDVLVDGGNRVVDVCQDFARQLADLGLSYYYQHYPIGSPAVEAMHALGFKTKERVTYRIDDLSDLDQVINAFSKNKKRQLQKALSLHADMNMSAEDFYRFHVQCLQEQGKQISYSREFLLVLDRKTQRLEQSQILSICNADNEVLAAAFLVWDKNYLYYLLPAMDNTYNDSGAGALLALEAMKLAREKHVRFDFEGSMNKGIARHYKQFGSTPTPYYSVEKYYKPLFRILIWIQKLREWKMNR
jgi:hypothetical protein